MFELICLPLCDDCACEQCDVDAEMMKCAALITADSLMLTCFMFWNNDSHMEAAERSMISWAFRLQINQVTSAWLIQQEPAVQPLIVQ